MLAQVGQVRVAGVEAVGGAAVKPLGNLAEGAACRADVSMRTTSRYSWHMRDMIWPAGVELAQLAADVALEGVELVQLFFRVEGQRAARVVVAA